MHRFVLGVFGALMVAGCMQAQSFTTGPCNSGEESTSNSGWFWGRQVKVCEVRRTTLPANGQVNVSGSNGGIEVVGEDRSDIALEAKLTAQDSSREEAQAVLRAVQVKTAGKIEADGPKQYGWGHHADWSVSYKLRVPRHLMVDAQTANGAVKVSGVDGTIHAGTVNGGVSLDDVSGEVHAETVNGGLHIALNGEHWRGAGLWARTVNGGVSVKVPEHYSAHLIAKTVNGGITVGLPVTMQGKIGHNVDGNLGEGGATMQIETVNGGIKVERGPEVQ